MILEQGSMNRYSQITNSTVFGFLPIELVFPFCLLLPLCTLSVVLKIFPSVFEMK